MNILFNELNNILNDFSKFTGNYTDLDRLNWLNKNSLIISKILIDKNRLNKYRFNKIDIDLINDIYISLLTLCLDFKETNEFEKLFTANMIIPNFIKIFRDTIPEQIYHLDLEYNKIINFSNLNNSILLNYGLLYNSGISNYNNDLNLFMSKKRNIQNSSKIYEIPDECCICTHNVKCFDRQSCGHYVHKHCIIANAKTECPICRNEIALTRDELMQIYYNNQK